MYRTLYIYMNRFSWYRFLGKMISVRKSCAYYKIVEHRYSRDRQVSLKNKFWISKILQGFMNILLLNRK